MAQRQPPAIHRTAAIEVDARFAQLKLGLFTRRSNCDIRDERQHSIVCATTLEIV